MGQYVIAVYRPKEGQDEGLRRELKTHVPILRRLGLATDAAPLLLRAPDGAYVEIFEWESEAAIDAAHTHPEVLAMWERFGAVCTYEPISKVAGCTQLFPPFQRVEL